MEIDRLSMLFRACDNLYKKSNRRFRFFSLN